MSNKIHNSSDPIDAYIKEHSLRLTSEQNELVEYTKTLPRARMLGSLDEGQFFQLLLRTMGGKRCIEVGTFTGYTTLTMALALPDDGQVFTCDVSDEFIRQDIWKKAGIEKKITLKLGAAVETLKQLLEEYGPNSFDFVFIDADKTSYMQYYELSLKLIRSNGIIAIDNTLQSGNVIDSSNTSENVVAIREVNDFIRDDQRVDISFLRLGDGTTLCRKK